MSLYPTKVPAIPKPPTSVDAETRRYLESLKEAIEIRLGRRGAPEDRAVTIRELIEAGVATSTKATAFNPNNFNTANLGFGSAAPDVEIDSSIPPTPLGFTATPAYNVVNLKWDIPTYGNLSHTEIWFNDVDDTLADALLLDIATGFYYTDALGSDETRYYWIRFISEDGIIGPYNAVDGTEAITSADVVFLLNVLNESITSSELHNDLSTPIGNLPTDTLSRLAEVNAKINDIKDTPAWAAGSAYVVGDLVTKDGNLYSALSAHTSTAANAPDTSAPIADTTEWKHIGGYGSLVDVLVQTETTTAQLADDYLSTVDTNSAIAIATNNLRTEVRGAFEAAHTYDFTGSNVNGFTGIRATVTTNANYLVYDETSSDASLNLVNAAGTIDGFTNRVVQVKIMRKEGGSDWQGWLRYSHAGSENVSYSGQLTYVQISDPTTTDEWAIAEFDMTDAPGWDNTIDDLRFDFGNNGNSKFHIEWIKIGANTKTLNAALQIQKTSVDGVEANYAVKIDNNGSIAGFGLASTTSDSGNVTSDFIVAADKFALMPSTNTAIVAWANATTYAVGDQVKSNNNFWICTAAHTSTNPTQPHLTDGAAYWNQTDKTPFTVVTSAQTVTVGNETVTVDPGVYIDAAYIKDASITAAKVGQLDADAITTGSFSANRIEGGTIDATTINISGTSASGMSIKSADSGARTEYRSKSIRVYDATRLRVHIGDLSDI